MVYFYAGLIIKNKIRYYNPKISKIFFLNLPTPRPLVAFGGLTRLAPMGARHCPPPTFFLTRRLSLFLRAKAECFARLCHRLGVRPSVCLSVCLSVRPSVTLVSCIKTVQARITKSLPWTAPRSLVYCDKISCHWVQGFPSNEGVEEGLSLIHI